MRGITIPFRGQDWSIPAERAFEIGERIEDIVTLSELSAWGARPKFYKLARCFGEMLRFAGCKVTDAEVHADMMQQIRTIAATSGSEDGGKNVLAAQAVGSLIELLMDGAPEGGGEAPGKNTAAS